jgi:hypothetical protein
MYKSPFLNLFGKYEKVFVELERLTTIVCRDKFGEISGLRFYVKTMDNKRKEYTIYGSHEIEHILKTYGARNLQNLERILKREDIWFSLDRNDNNAIRGITIGFE